MKRSIWDNIEFKQEVGLTEDIETDVLIIGGGIAGISTAYHLIGCGKKVTLIDRDVCGRGVSLYTTAKLTYLQQLNYYKLKKMHGFEKAKDYLLATKEIITTVKDIIEKNDMECDFEEVPSYVMSNDNNIVRNLFKIVSYYNATKNNLTHHYFSLMR